MLSGIQRLARFQHISEFFIGIWRKTPFQIMSSCTVCLQRLDNGDPTVALTCCHAFHQYCAETYAEAMGCTMETLACPVCKRTSADVDDLERAPRSVPSSWSGASSSWQAQGASSSWQGPTVNLLEEIEAAAPEAAAPAAEAVALTAPEAAAPETAAPASPEVAAPATPEVAAAATPVGAPSDLADEVVEAEVAEAMADPAELVELDPDPAGLVNALNAALALAAHEKGKNKGKGVGKASRKRPAAALEAPSARRLWPAGVFSAGEAREALAGGEADAALVAPEGEAEAAAALVAPEAPRGGAKAAAAVEGEAALVAHEGEAAPVALAKAASQVALPRPLFEEPTVFCSSCGNMVLLRRTRLLSKTKGTWQCSECRVILTQLYRGFGPGGGEFQKLSEEEQRDFFNSAAGAGSRQVLEKAKELFLKREEHSVYYDCGGSFLPLSVWQAKGYDTAAIEQKSAREDKGMHPVLGTTYRVRILKTGSRGSESKIRQHELEKKSGKKPRQGAGAAEAAAAVEAAEAAAAVEGEVPPPSPEEESESSLSSSSSSSEKKKNKKKSGKKPKKESKKKKAKKEKERKLKEKEKAKAEAADAKAKTKETAGKKTLATQTLAKVSPLVLSMQSSLATPASVNLPDMILNSVKTALDDLQILEKKARLVLEDATSHSLGHSSMKDIAGQLHQAKKSEALMLQMMVSLNRFTGRQ